MDTGMACSANFTFYTIDQLNALKDAIIASRLERVTGGTITSGGKNGKNYAVTVAEDAELCAIEQELARRLNSRGPTKRRISFRNAGRRNA